MTRFKFTKALGMWLLPVAAPALLCGQADDEFFEKKIRPVLATSCYGCHSSKMKAPMGGLALDTKAGLLSGGASGPAIAPGKPADSLLVRALGYNDLRLKMPPTGKLSEAVIADFKQWIKDGAADPRTEPSANSAPSTGRVIDFTQGRKWWAFLPAKELIAPQAGNSAWARSKIDSFVLASLEKNGLKPSGEADARTLIRRAYLDLIGLKPSYEEIESFARDTAPDRYPKLVERLLASPQYGERWARYWLDVARYGEDAGAAGLQFPYAWRYRDWVIEALNKDVPYDRFVKLQMAADHIPDTPRDDLRALGFLSLAPVEHKELKLAKDVIETLMLDEWDERVDAVTRGLLGLTVACARCHDHKFDPISNKDYYALAGVFASTSTASRPLHNIDAAVENRYLWAVRRVVDLGFAIRTLSKNDGAHRELAARQVKEFEVETAGLQAEIGALKERYPELADTMSKVAAAEKTQNSKRRAEDPKAPFINAVYDAGLWLDDSHPDMTMMIFKPGQPRDLPLFRRGSATSPGEIVPRRFLTVLAKNQSGVFKRGSGRLDLAESILTDSKPLAARVIVNRVWGWHFDKHLVGTPSDFGTRGDLPTHPELLDDLAARFIANGWSLKWLHREIMLSATYRQSSHNRPDGEEKDPANKLLWRMNSRRLDIEAFRDSLLQATGSLNLTMYGPSLDPEALDNSRRTVYAKIGRARPSEILRMYDFPSPFQHSPLRTLTITPLQQLFVMNSPFLEQLSAALAKSVQNEPDGGAKVRALYRKAFSRDPNPGEVDLALSYLHGASVDQLALVLLATNEEIFWP